MKFIVEQSALTDGVNWVSRSLSTRPIKTELLGIVIDATSNEVFLSASDLETASKAHFAAEVKELGKVLVPGKLLAEISRSLPNKPITFVGESANADAFALITKNAGERLPITFTFATASPVTVDVLVVQQEGIYESLQRVIQTQTPVITEEVKP